MAQPPFAGPADPVGAPPASRRGCAAIVLVSAVLVLVLLGGAGIGILAWLGAPGGQYEAAPGCAVVEETDALDALVPDHRAELAERIDTGGQGWWDGNQCRWSTTAESAGMPASLSVAFVRSGNRLGVSGERAAGADLEHEPEQNSATAVTGLGDEAVRWYDSATLHGCAAVRLSNLMVTACYEASTDFSATRELPEAEAVEHAVTAAREIVDIIEPD